MAAATSAIIALGGLGLSAGQMVKANKDKQKAAAAATAAAGAIANNKQKNPFESLQAPDVASLAQQANLQTQAQSVRAVQGMGAEGAGAIGQIGLSARSSNLQASEAQAKINYQRDAAQAQAQQEIDAQQYTTETGLELSRLQGAQQEMISADAKRSAAISGMFGAAGQAVTGIGDAAPLYRKQKQAKAPRGTTIVDNTSMAPGQNQPQNMQSPQDEWTKWSLNASPVSPGSVVVQ